MAPYSSDRGSNVRPRIIELHTGEGILSRLDMVRFLDDNDEASAHAASDAGGVEAPLVPYLRAAWTAGPTANSIGLHIEMCAFAVMSRAQWLSEQDVTVFVPWIGPRGENRLIRSPMSMLRHTAAWVRSVATQFGIPLVKLTAADLRAGKAGICGHADSSAAWGETDHTDPGSGFPWTEFLALVGGQEIDDMALVNETITVYPVPGGTDTRKTIDGKEALGRAVQAGWSAEAVGRQNQQLLVALTAAVGALAADSDITPDNLLDKVTEAVRAENEAHLGRVDAVIRESLGSDNAEVADMLLHKLGEKILTVPNTGL